MLKSREEQVWEEEGDSLGGKKIFKTDTSRNPEVGSNKEAIYCSNFQSGNRKGLYSLLHYQGTLDLGLGNHFSVGAGIGFALDSGIYTFRGAEPLPLCQPGYRTSHDGLVTVGTEHAAAELIGHLLSPPCAHRHWWQRLCALMLSRLWLLCLGPTSPTGFSAATSLFYLETQPLPFFKFHFKGRNKYINGKATNPQGKERERKE